MIYWTEYLQKMQQPASDDIVLVENTCVDREHCVQNEKESDSLFVCVSSDTDDIPMLEHNVLLEHKNSIILTQRPVVI